MTKITVIKPKASILRQRAEEQLKKESPKTSSHLSDVETLKLLHELQVHQIELEMQNEELKLAKEQSDKSLHIAMQVANMAWWKMEISTGNVTFEKRKAEMLGYTPEKFKHFKDFMELIHPEDNARAMNAMHGHISGLFDKYEAEYRILTKSGEYKWFYDIGSVVEKDSKGNPVLIAGMVVDISERKEAEAMLSYEKQRLACILEGTNVGTWEWNILTGETVYNERWANCIGYTLDELFPTSVATWTKYCHPEDLKFSSELLEKHFNGELDYYKCELRMKHKNGDWIWILDRGKIHKWDENGKPLLMSGTHQEISERKHSEEELKYRMTELTNAYKQLDKYISDNNELKQFAYISSHQLTHPIRTISNYIKIIEEDYSEALDSKALKYLKIVMDSAERMNLLILSLSDFSRLGQNKILQTVDGKKMVNDVIADLESVIISSGASIEVSEMPVFKVYEVELRQVFLNLISNAIKYHKRGIRPEIKIGSELINGVWQFYVSDNGIGIPTDQHEKIFDMFQRLYIDEEEYEGKGIGLAFCEKIVELHHGKIWIESILGQGTKVYFTIPNLIL